MKLMNILGFDVTIISVAMEKERLIYQTLCVQQLNDIIKQSFKHKCS